MSNDPYIPLSPAEVVRLCQRKMVDVDRRALHRLAKLLRAWYHYSYLDELAELKALYMGRRLDAERDEPEPIAPKAFANALHKLATAANYTPIDERDLTESLARESVFRIGIHVDFNDFAEIVFYRRGESEKRAKVKIWHGLREKEVTFTNYERVLVYVRFRDARHFADRSIAFEPGSAMLKLFQNVPKTDLEMLFPNTEVRMKLRDKLYIGVPAAASGIIMLTTKIGGTLLLLVALMSFWLGLRDEPVKLDQTALVALLTAGGALGAYFWKQFSNFKNRKISFMKALAENLYFKNLDNNLGVLTYLVDSAEEADFKEVMLGYTYLHCTGASDMDSLRQGVTAWVDHPGFSFDAEGAMTKLEELALASASERDYRTVDPDTAFARIDARWDALFDSDTTGVA